ncbi:flagellar hook-length control protein FliK [Fusibacter sp. JL216-2]|uniref:flagellar hook-length control protein FliK n=1 Tax=Fusibacter sp. JL216-2 TaxID=3071453 RepID=UPI003D34916B
MLNGGSAVQNAYGLDTRQGNSSSGKSKSSEFDFKAVFEEKRYEAKKVDYTKDYAPREASKNSKLNNDEMTGRKRPEVQEATDTDKSAKKETVSDKRIEENSDDLKKVDETKLDDETKAVKKLLEKLGLSEEEIASLMEVLPEDLMASLVKVIEEMPQLQMMTEMDESVQMQLSESIKSLEAALQSIVAHLSSMEDIPQNMLVSLEDIGAKLELAEMNLEEMTAKDFAQMVTEVMKEDVSQSSSTEGVSQDGDAEVEIIDVKVIDKEEEVTTNQTELETNMKTDETSKDSSAGDSNQKSDQSGHETVQASQGSILDDFTEEMQPFSEALKVENPTIKSAQPMEHMASRVRLAQNIMSQVLDGTKLNINPTENGQQIILRLRPEELGNVDLKLSVEKGILMAEFNVESQVVKETLESNMSDLKQALAEKGYNIEGMQVSVGQEQTDQQGQLEQRFFAQRAKRKYFFGDEESMPDFESINKTLAGLQSTFEYLG